MSEQRRITKRIVKGFPIAAAAALLVGCGSDSAGSGIPSFSKDAHISAGDFLAQQVAAGRVRRCIGQTSLRGEGHVRTEPSTLGGTVIEGYSEEFNQTHNVVVQKPLHIQVDNGGTASVDWFATQLPNGEIAFTNSDALVDPSALQCNAQATASDPLGKILVDPAQ